MAHPLIQLLQNRSAVSEEQRLMVFENRVLSEIFGPKETA
jgi:hypothetical protein